MWLEKPGNCGNFLMKEGEKYRKKKIFAKKLKLLDKIRGEIWEERCYFFHGKKNLRDNYGQTEKER